MSKQYVLVSSEVPVPIEDADELVEAFRGILKMGMVQRVEFRSDKKFATVERMTPADEIQEGESVIQPVPNMGPLRTENLDLYALVRSGDVPMEELDASEAESFRHALAEGHKVIEERNLRVAYTLASTPQNLERRLGSMFRPGDTVLGSPAEFDTNIPGDAVFLFGGLYEGCDKSNLSVAIRVVLPDMRSDYDADGADDSARAGTEEGGDGAGEEWADSPGDGAPALFGPTSE
tara:strand:+ start:873 stop:1574 length:702 start_codon:yes stop_codon:yes gene_type:complete